MKSSVGLALAVFLISLNLKGCSQNSQNTNVPAALPELTVLWTYETGG